VERRSINDALEAWDVSAGNDIGLMAEMGLIAHRMSSPVLPATPSALRHQLVTVMVVRATDAGQ